MTFERVTSSIFSSARRGTCLRSLSGRRMRDPDRIPGSSSANVDRGRVSDIDGDDPSDTSSAYSSGHTERSNLLRPSGGPSASGSRRAASRAAAGARTSRTATGRPKLSSAAGSRRPATGRNIDAGRRVRTPSPGASDVARMLARLPRTVPSYGGRSQLRGHGLAGRRRGPSRRRTRGRATSPRRDDQRRSATTSRADSRSRAAARVAAARTLEE